MLPSRDEVARALQTLLTTESWDQARAVLEREHSLLLTDVAEELLAALVHDARSREEEQEDITLLSQYLALLRRARDIGIDAAWQEFITRERREQEYTQVALTLQIVQDFLGTTSWDETKTLLEREQQILLTDQAEQIIRSLIQEADNYDDAERRRAYIELHLLLIRRAREAGTEAAWREFIAYRSQPNEQQQEILAAIQALLQTSRWSETRAVLEREQALLLTDQAEQLMLAIMDDTRSRPDGERRSAYLLQHLHLMQRARTIGIPAAWDEFVAELQRESEQSTEHLYNDLPEALRMWLLTPTYREERRYIESHPTLLLPDAETTLERYQHTLMRIAAEQGSDEVLRHQIDDIRNHRFMLRDIHARGGTIVAIREAYVNTRGGFMLDMPPWLEEVEWQLAQIGRRGPRHETAKNRIAVLRGAMDRAKFDPAVAIEAIAEMNLRLWDALDDLPGATSAEHEEGIACLQTALDGYTRERYPVQWAQVQGNLGTAYSQRLSGTRQDNLESALAAYQRALEIFTRDTYPREWAKTQSNLGGVYGERIAGDRRENQERAIQCHQQALEIFTRDLFPIEWATTQSKLGHVYGERIAGDLGDNQEQAINRYTQALDVITRDDYPLQWASLHVNLGMTYMDRLAGDESENLEQAIAHLTYALEIFTAAEFPLPWARTHGDLGNVYMDRLAGERRDNIEQAIAHYQRALEVFTHTDFPIEWARTQNNIGMAYSRRVMGDPRENLEESIAACRRALEVFTRDATPLYWARSQMHLGHAYRNRIQGDRRDNQEQAIAAYTQALDITLGDVHAPDWAQIQRGLGQIYAHRIAGDRRENQEQAIAALTGALAYYTREGYPVEWAAIRLELGQIYANRLTGDQDANVEMALEEFTRASEVYTRATHPFEWARVQSQRGTAYLARLTGDHSENVEQAIAALLRALEVHTSESTPALWAQDQWNLGKAYARRTHGDHQANLTEALSHLRQAINAYYTADDYPLEHRDIQLAIARIYRFEIAAEAERNGDQSAAQNAFRRMHEALTAARQIQQGIGWLVADVDPETASKDLGQIFTRDAECLWRLGEMPQAVVALETGRVLALLRQQDAAGALTAGVCEEHAAMFDAARQRMKEACARGDPALMRASHAMLAQSQVAIRGHCDAGFLPTTPEYEDIARAAAPDQAIVYLCAGDMSGTAFVVPPAVQERHDPVAIALPQLTRATVDSWLWRKDAEGHVIGGYVVAVQLGGAAQLETWTGMEGDAERERRLALPVGDIAAQLSPVWSTLRYALGGVMTAWRMQLHRQPGMPLRDVLRDDAFTSALNWFFLEGEIERLLHDLHDAGITDLRAALDAQELATPDQPIALIPCGRLGALPLHAAWARRDPVGGTLVPLMETCELTYQPAAHALGAARNKAAQMSSGSVYAIGNPQPTQAASLLFAAYEAEAIATLARHAGRASVALTGVEATRQNVLDLLAQARDGAVLDLATQGYIGDDANAGYLQFGGNDRLTLAELQQDRLLDGVRLLISSGCVATLGAGDMTPAEFIDGASGFLLSGAAGVIATRWPAADRATALLVIALLGNVLANPGRSTARALRDAARWLRTATRRQLDELSAGGIPGVAPLPVGPDAARGIVKHLGDGVDQLIGLNRLPLDVMTLSDMPYHHPIYWAVAAAFGT